MNFVFRFGKDEELNIILKNEEISTMITEVCMSILKKLKEGENND